MLYNDALSRSRALYDISIILENITYNTRKGKIRNINASLRNVALPFPLHRVISMFARIILNSVGVSALTAPLTPKRHVTFDISHVTRIHAAISKLFLEQKYYNENTRLILRRDNYYYYYYYTITSGRVARVQQERVSVAKLI